MPRPLAPSLSMLSLLLMLLFAPAGRALQVGSSPEEEVVRAAYASLSFLTALPPVTDAASAQMRGEFVSQSSLTKRKIQSTPVFQLSNFHTGTVSSIAESKWTDLVTFRTTGKIIEGSAKTNSYSDNGNEVHWESLDLRWKPARTVTESARQKLDQTLVEDVAALITREMPYPGTINRYCSYDVTLDFQGESTSYKALFFFGSMQKANGEIVVPIDRVGGGELLSKVVTQPTYPTGLLKSKLRDQPAMEHWIAENRMQGNSCLPAKSGLCCTGDRCGLPADSVARDLATRLPEPR